MMVVQMLDDERCNRDDTDNFKDEHGDAPMKKKKVKYPKAAAEYKAALAKLNWTQVRAAREMGVDPRTSRRWALGESRAPYLVMRYLEEQEEGLIVRRGRE